MGGAIEHRSGRQSGMPRSLAGRGQHLIRRAVQVPCLGLHPTGPGSSGSDGSPLAVVGYEGWGDRRPSIFWGSRTTAWRPEGDLPVGTRGACEADDPHPEADRGGPAQAALSHDVGIAPRVAGVEPCRSEPSLQRSVHGPVPALHPLQIFPVQRLGGSVPKALETAVPRFADRWR